MTTPLKLTPARQAADALVSAGLVQATRADAAAAVITAHMPKGGSYSFASDAEFMHSCLEHHVGAYFRQVLEPAAMAHHKQNQTGRMLTDKEITEAGVTITSQVMRELGTEYRLHLGKYLGNDEGITAYLFSRIHGALLDAARTFNDEYLTSLSRRQNSQRIRQAAAAVAGS